MRMAPNAIHCLPFFPKTLLMKPAHYPVPPKMFDLEDRMISFSVVIIDVVENLPKNLSSNHLAKQLIRSGTAPALMYGEAKSAESKRDFVHKMKLALKELRETHICLKIIHQKRFIDFPGLMEFILQENHELISIFVKSIVTAQNSRRD